MTDMQKDQGSINQTNPAAGDNLDLQALREARGLSLKDIFERTRIGVAYLEAIEKGQYHLLPEPAYAKAFIKGYALAVGADSQNLLCAYEAYLKAANERLQQEQDEDLVRQKSQKRRKQAAWLFPLAAAAIIVFFMFSQCNKQEPNSILEKPTETIGKMSETKPEETGSPVAPSPLASEKTEAATIVQEREKPSPEPAKPAIDVKATPIPTAPVERPAAATETSYRLVLEARESVWLRIRVGNNSSQQMFLKAGDRVERVAADVIWLEIGNAGGLDITFQNKPLGSIGKQGQVVRLRLPPL